MNGSAKGAEIVVIGSHCPGLFIRVKRPPVPGETVIGWDFQEPIDGGKGSNQAIAASKLGGMVSFVGCVGQDRIGEEGARWMVEAGVDITFLKRSATTASGVGFILLDEQGVPAMVSGMGPMLS
jgi:ribokinase